MRSAATRKQLRIALVTYTFVDDLRDDFCSSMESVPEGAAGEDISPAQGETEGSTTCFKTPVCDRSGSGSLDLRPNEETHTDEELGKAVSNLAGDASSPESNPTGTPSPNTAHPHSSLADRSYLRNHFPSS